ncbi:hypothetical protein WA556_003125, partial [Blastocystis sp. ATCC 50177/Nand II]
LFSISDRQAVHQTGKELQIACVRDLRCDVTSSSTAATTVSVTTTLLNLNVFRPALLSLLRLFQAFSLSSSTESAQSAQPIQPAPITDWEKPTLCLNVAPKELSLTLLTVAPDCSAHPQDDYTPIGSLLLADASITVTSCPARLLLRIAAASCQLVQHDPVEEVVVRASRGDTPQIVFSFTHYSPLAPSYPHHAMDISLSLSPLHGTARLAFILRLLHSVTEGTLLSSFQSDEPVADPTPTDYSTGARLSLFFSSVSV